MAKTRKKKKTIITTTIKARHVVNPIKHFTIIIYDSRVVVQAILK